MNAPRRDRAVAFAWGLAEATLFFVVPDVWLTRLALRGARPAWIGALVALAGALCGGTVVYLWSVRSYDAAAAAVQAVPAIGEAMVARVGRDLERNGLVAMVLGGFSGTPYKVFALEAPRAGIALPVFLLYTIPARALRFAAAVSVTRLVGPKLPDRPRTRVGILLGFWCVFYVAYLSLMPW